jgi:hypothetical protein
MPTSNRNDQKGSRNTPAANVSGSPMIGAQLSNKLHLPYLLYQFVERSSCLSDMGNHHLPLKLCRPRPRIQFTTAPNTLPTLAVATSNHTVCPPAAINAASPNSDCAGKTVAARKETVKSAHNVEKSAIPIKNLSLEIEIAVGLAALNRRSVHIVHYSQLDAPCPFLLRLGHTLKYHWH